MCNWHALTMDRKAVTESNQASAALATEGPHLMLESSLLAFIRVWPALCPLERDLTPDIHMGGWMEQFYFQMLFPWTQSHMECPHGSQVCQFFVWVNPHAWIVFITWRSVICTQMCTFHSLNWRWTLLLFRPTRSNQKNRARICIQVLSALPRGRYISKLFRHDKNLCRRIKWEDKNVLLLIAVVWMRVPSHRFSSQVSSD